MANSLHPVARILLWCGWAVAVERAALPPLMMLAVVTATAFLFMAVRAQALRLLRRTRWLLLVLLVTYAYSLPGTPLWPDLGAFSPTVEGIQQGGLRVTRLVLMLVGLAALLAYTTRSRLVYGLYVLAWPFTWLGLDRRAFAVRLGLTLDYAEHAQKPARWLDGLRTPLVDVGTPTAYTLQSERWQRRDSLVILAGLLALWWVLG